MKEEIKKILRNWDLGSFNIKNTSWDSAVGYTYNEDKNCIYLPVVNKFKKLSNLDNFQLLVNPIRWKWFKYNIIWVLNQNFSDEEIKFYKDDLIKNKKFSEEDANYSLYDQRNWKLKKNRHKLVIKKIEILF